MHNFTGNQNQRKYHLLHWGGGANTVKHFNWNDKHENWGTIASLAYMLKRDPAVTEDDFRSNRNMLYKLNFNVVFLKFISNLLLLRNYGNKQHFS